VKFVQEAVADGAQVIQQQGDAGLDHTSKFFGNRLAHNSSIWMFAIEHSASTMASWRFTIVRTVWCHRTRAADVDRLHLSAPTQRTPAG
jgi:hypothetical protein